MKIFSSPSPCRIAIVAALLAFTPLAPQAFAAEEKAAETKAPVVDIIPAHSYAGAPEDGADTEATHPVLRVTPDKSEIITLEADAASVIVGNPNHANIVADSVRKLVVIPRSPGATYFTVLDKDGNVIMQRHVIVASPKEDYVRVKRVCNEESGDACKNTSVFYCPDMCHEIGSQTEKDSGSKQSSDMKKAAENMSKTAEETSSEEGTSSE